ncbi:hypothetical protein [uncultured Piscinibacter sp.]|uniref:hypothetical protein n=1 Tax=uncultured Piscinibacter sp. TaxID=1131835 RepID=UPI002628F042|nr:hypothetical protein [uncultured Piscinibacter sp.]
MGEAVWWLVAALAAACALLLGLLLRRPRSAVPSANAPAVAPSSPASAGVRPAGTAVDAPTPGGGLAPLPGPAAPLRSPMTALVAPPAVKPPTTLVVPRARRYELRDAAPAPVLTLERACDAEWQRVAVAAATPMQREVLSAALAHAPLLAPLPEAAEGDLFRVTLRAGSALALARGELAGAPAGTLRATPAQSLDASRSAPLAAIVLALRCGPVYLRGLRRDVGAIQAEAAPWLKQSGPGDERLRVLLQDLSRYLREVEENHAGVIRKPVFVARVADFCVQAEAQWRAASDGAAALRSGLESLLPAVTGRPAGVAEWRGLWQQYALRRRVSRGAARTLAAWHGLRLALGEAVPAAALVLRSALQALRTADEADAALGRSARAAARELGVPLEAEAGEAAQREVRRTIQAIDAGFAGEAELTLLLQLDALGRVQEVRGPLATE